MTGKLNIWVGYVSTLDQLIVIMPSIHFMHLENWIAYNSAIGLYSVHSSTDFLVWPCCIRCLLPHLLSYWKVFWKYQDLQFTSIGS